MFAAKPPKPLSPAGPSAGALLSPGGMTGSILPSACFTVCVPSGCVISCGWAGTPYGWSTFWLGVSPTGAASTGVSHCETPVDSATK
jgi:hypothetical protein